MSAPNAVALVGQEDEAIRPLPVAPTAQKLAMALPSLDELIVLERYGKMFAESGLFPQVQTWQAAAAIIQYGSQLGIDAFTALKDIHWIKGKPSCDASLINSLIKRDHGDEAIMPSENTTERCTIRYKRRGWDRYEELTVTADQYQHLINDTSRVTWRTNRQDMLWARCISTIGRRHFPDTIKGLYTRDELRDVDAMDASYRVVDRAGGAAPGDSAPTVERDQAAPAAAGDDRAKAATAVGNAITRVFRVRKGEASHIARDLICYRFDLEDPTSATTEQLKEIWETVDRWQTADVAKSNLAWLTTISTIETESELVDVGADMESKRITDPFLHAAIGDRLTRFEEEAARAQLAEIDAAVEGAVVP